VLTASSNLVAEPKVGQGPPMRVAVIDTDSGFVKVLSARFDAAGWEHRHFSTGIPAEHLVAMKATALIVDVDVLGKSRWDYLGQVCGMLPRLAVIVCALDSSVADRVRGLRIGADDWISKPCHPEEVAARIEAACRRHRQDRLPTDLGPLVAGEVEIRPDQFQAFVSGQSLGLTRREFELIHLLAESNGQVLDRETIYQRVWGYAMARGDRSVDVFVRKLRLKLRRGSPGWSYIHTHVGVGYRFEAQPDGQDAQAGSQVFHSAVTEE
jgi:DNA-binding response OmpR family regulator